MITSCLDYRNMSSLQLCFNEGKRFGRTAVGDEAGRGESSRKQLITPRSDYPEHHGAAKETRRTGNISTKPPNQYSSPSCYWSSAAAHLGPQQQQQQQQQQQLLKCSAAVKASLNHDWNYGMDWDGNVLHVAPPAGVKIKKGNIFRKSDGQFIPRIICTLKH